MSETRAVALAVALSSCLHAGVVGLLRGLDAGPFARDEPSRHLFVDLVVPPVAARPASPAARAEAPPAEPRPGPRGRQAAVRLPHVVPPPPAQRRSPSPAAPRPLRLPGRPRAALGPGSRSAAVGSPPRPLPRGSSGPPPPPPVLRPGSAAAAPVRGTMMVVRAPETVAPTAPAPLDAVVHEQPESPAPGTAVPPDRTPGAARSREGRFTDRAPGTGSQGTAPGTGDAAHAALANGRGALPPEYEAYVRAFRQRIQQRLVYPRLAVRRGLEGTVELMVDLDASGRLSEVTVLRGEVRELREAAVRAVHDATPFPGPSRAGASGLRIRLPVVFQLE